LDKILGFAMSPSIIIFDFGGVTGGTDWALLAQSIAPLLSLSQDQALNLLRQYRASKHTPMTPEAFWSAFEKQSGITLPVDWLATLEDLRCLATSENKAVIDIVHQLKDRGYRVALFSNVSPLRAAYVRRKGLYNHFDPVVLSCDIGAKKPAPEAFRALFDHLKAPPETCLLIDDKAQTVEAAKQLGMDGIVFSSVSNVLEELRQRGILLNVPQSQKT
jgi:HAD superfamily hydrolase (TIGR01509 family)